MGGDGVGVVVWLKDKNNVDLVLDPGGGFPAKVSGQVTYIGSPADTRVAGILGNFDDDSGPGVNGLVTTSYLHAYDQLANRWARVYATATVSGQGYRLMVTISGESVSIIGGVKISGETVNTQPIGSNTIRSGALVSPSSTSGGTALPTGSIRRVKVKAPAFNSGNIFIGSTTSPPFSGGGYILDPGSEIELYPTNLNLIKGFAAVAGDKVCFIGEDYP